ncbi:PQQ-binding-like beta-propeller repeat protein [Halalkalibacter alkaliphilus]|uniref:PQQ-binding-like beta-propeller repeat protein n=1 Tax=Halalkalibacter alkaliphilus TaxID=2917993 RepID=A0A9X2CVT9_9BACI|nr:PQQ-binding-like beta-propeller repeat protein [Halalkalibacter alkaliphilus]MCL7749193.1 PQQ-binding-like beta-propeller repeat protein [Halalkalibacter alkaliphilus]
MKQIRLSHLIGLLFISLLFGCQSVEDVTSEENDSSEEIIQEDWVFHGTKTNYTLSGGVIEDGILYIGDYNKYFYALEQDSGNVIWNFESHTINPFRPVLAGELVLFANYGGRLYALNKNNGELVWDFQTETGMSNQYKRARQK